MAAFNGKDVKKLKSKGGKWKYISEEEMLNQSEKFAPYRYVTLSKNWNFANIFKGVYSCGEYSFQLPLVRSPARHAIPRSTFPGSLVVLESFRSTDNCSM